MARVARGHGGDGAGDPPAPYWKPESGCLASGKKLRSYAKNLEVEKLRNDNGAPLDIEFDIRTKTYNPVGPNAKYFASLLGTLARSVPFYYDSWEQVPEEAKEHVWPCLEVGFVY
uniref:uncharacterized protein LOC122609319 n=1 Tax=Erigeron canadensis TaxID=72917 RepID=UPI001CB92D29|nr:uncharacterized protein LOC122609319 [Erigeron canadensis]